MASAPKFTIEQYLAYDGLFEFRLEYHAGRILPVEIPDRFHSLIRFNLALEIRRRIQDRFCSVLENQRLRPAPAHYIYADLALVSDAPRFVDERVDTLLNPKAIVEVSSPGSWSHDDAVKGRLYHTMPDCAEYWLIHTEDVKAEHWTRLEPNKWRIQFIEDPEAVFRLESFAIEFPLALAYRGTGFVDLPVTVPRSTC